MDGRLVAKWLEENDFDRVELARMLDVNPSTIWRYLSGKRKSVDRPFSMAVELAMDWLAQERLKRAQCTPPPRWDASKY